MARIPTLKISKQALDAVLKSEVGEGYELIASKIYQAAGSEDYRHRSIITVKKDRVQKAIVSLETSSSDFEKFNGALASERKLLNHVGIFSIRSNTKEYTIMLEIVEYANDFCKAFDFDKENGYRKYIRYGLQLIGKKYGLSKFKYFNAKIFEHFESINLLKNDPDPIITNYMYEVWKHQMVKHKQEVPAKLAPEKAVSFLYARECAAEAKADFKNWVIAQFSELSFLSIIPELTQFYGDKAKDRYASHIGKVILRWDKEGKKFKSPTREQIVENLKQVSA